MWKKSKVIRKEGEFCTSPIWDTKGYLHYHGKGSAVGNIHLYILSDDEIRVGDWCYNETDPILKGDIYQAEDSVDLEFLTGKDESSPIKGTTKKIIGSTDLSINVARLPDEFVREYCRLGGIDNVMVEYCCAELEINSDNTINIRKIKEYYSREELISYVTKAWNDRCQAGNNGWEINLPENIKSWIENNIE